MHAIAIGFPLSTGLYALHGDMMNPLPMWPGICWLQDFPDGCHRVNDGDDCIRGANYYDLSILCGTYWTGLLLLIMAFLLFAHLSACPTNGTAHGPIHARWHAV